MARPTKRQPVRITKVACDRLAKGETIYDTEIRGFRAACLPSGRITFGFQYSSPKGGGRPYMALGLMGEVTPDQARTLAAGAALAVKHGRDPVAEKELENARTENTVDHVLDQWLELYAKELRSADACKGIFERHVRPAIGRKAIYDVSRADITKMLDKVTENAGPVMADRTLAHLRSAFNWWRIRDENFVTQPIVKGMARTTIKQRQRKRALDQQEIRDVWLALDQIEANAAPSFYPAYVRTLLLLGCRRDEVADMHTDEFNGDDWIIPSARYKTKLDHLLPLPATVRAMLPQRKDGFVFSSDGGKTPFSGFSKSKAALDKAIAELRKREGRKPMPAWQLRDLRRTLRTRMIGDLKVDDLHAKKVLGHVTTGIDSTYNVYQYRDEKAEALQKWAAFITGLVSPTPENVVRFAKKKNVNIAAESASGS